MAPPFLGTVGRGFAKREKVLQPSWGGGATMGVLERLEVLDLQRFAGLNRRHN